jgi:hypothetical protein
MSLHATHEFSVDADELLRRALEHFELADLLLTRAHEVGLTTPAGRGALSGSRDASVTALKFITALGLHKVDALNGTAGRKPDMHWSTIRRQRPRDHLTGRPA